MKGGESRLGGYTIIALAGLAAVSALVWTGWQIADSSNALIERIDSLPSAAQQTIYSCALGAAAGIVLLWLTRPRAKVKGGLSGNDNGADYPPDDTGDEHGGPTFI